MEQFTFVKRGYDPEEVDKYITTLEQVIKSYKDKDNAIKNAIISAQVAADNVVRNAQAQAESYKVQISDQLTEMRNTLDMQRRRLQAFHETYANMMRKYIKDIEQAEMADLFSKIDEMEMAISDLQGLEVVSGSRNDEYLGQDEARDYRGNLPDAAAYHDNRPAPRDFGPEPTRDNRDFPRDAAMHDRNMMRDPGREMMRPPGREAGYPPPQEHMHDPRDRDMRGGREIMPPPGHEPPMRDPRDVRGGRDMMPPPPHEPMRDPRDRDMRGGREMMPPPGHEPPMRDVKDAMRPPEPPMRDGGREFLAEPPRDAMRGDPGRDMRRDAGRDVRRDAGRDIRRDGGGRPPGRDMRDAGPMRPDSREQVRDMGRNYMPEQDNYGDNDKNLLPPVASLM